MGQAKARGSFEARQAQAFERIEQERLRQEEIRKQEELKEAERRAELEIERNKPARIYSPAGISSRNRSTLMMAALALSAGVQFKKPAKLD
jgi:hypothetical protein